jgi:ABC-type multidrug transport system fused ATPase/permease subunit
MIKFFSWLIIFAGIIYFAGIFILPFVTTMFIPVFFFIAIGLGVIGAVGLLISVIRERIKDQKEEDKNDLSKY